MPYPVIDAPTQSLESLIDTTITTPINSDILTYQSGVWVNSAPSAGAVWGSITGTLSDQTDLQGELDVKEPANSNIQSHISDITTNPHSVTQTQVGLPNVDNTSDVNKPVSTATQTAIDLKANLISPNLTGLPTSPTPIDNATPTAIATTQYVFDNSGGGSLDELSDVTITTPIQDEILTYNGTIWVNQAPTTPPSPALDDLIDVIITTPLADEVLAYDGADWINQPLAITFDQVVGSGSDYPLTISDAFSWVKITATSASTVTIPPESTTNFQIGTDLVVTQYGTGAVTIVGDVGVTVNSAGGLLTIADQFAAVTLVKVGADEWQVTGALV